MPLTEKGKEILTKMEKEYGSEKGERVFYASANKGAITGVHDAMDQSKLDAVVGMCQAYDAKDASIEPKEWYVIYEGGYRSQTVYGPVTKAEADRWLNQNAKPSERGTTYKLSKRARNDSAQLDDVIAMCSDYDQKDAAPVIQAKAKQIVDLMNKRGYGPREILEKIRAGYEVPQSMDPEMVATEAERVIRNKQNIKSMEVPSRRDSTQLDDVMAACDEYERKDARKGPGDLGDPRKPELGPGKGWISERLAKQIEKEVKELHAKGYHAAGIRVAINWSRDPGQRVDIASTLKSAISGLDFSDKPDKVRGFQGWQDIGDLKALVRSFKERAENNRKLAENHPKDRANLLKSAKEFDKDAERVQAQIDKIKQGR